MIDESGQEKAGEHTAGVKRQYLGCAGRVANGINVVYASYAAPAGHAVIAARLYVPRDWADDRERRRAAGIPDDLEFKTKPQLAAEIVQAAHRRGALPAVGDRRRSLRPRRQAADLPGRPAHRVCAEDPLLVPGHPAHRAEDARRSRRPAGPGRAWQTASAGHGSKGERDYGWAWLATASARHHLLIRRSLTDPADLAFFYCHVPAGRACSFTTLVRVAGRRWPVEEDFALGKSWFGLADSQVRRYTAITRHLALAMAALAVCAITAALARARTSTLARPPASPDDLPPEDPGLIPLTVAEIKRVFNLITRIWQPIRHYLHWSWWRRRHQARARWFHQRARLRRRQPIQVSSASSRRARSAASATARKSARSSTFAVSGSSSSASVSNRRAASSISVSVCFM